jgi:hypothetical protein
VPSTKNVPKQLAAKKAAALDSVQRLLQSLNQPMPRCRPAGEHKVSEHSVPTDWLSGGTVVFDPHRHFAALSAQATNPPLPPPMTAPAHEQARAALERLGLSLESDVRPCKCCALWFIASSRKAEVCLDCRGGRWPTMYRRAHRAALLREAGIRPRTRKKNQN